LKPLDLNVAIEEIVAILGRIIDPRIAVEVTGVPELWTVTADPSRINQVLMNLCLNARDAMPEGGRLLLETRNVELDASAASTHPDARPGQYVRLRVGDTGHGIPPDILPRIFDPFVTTKEPGKGTGLGLTTVASIVKQHQGWIECLSAVGHGTVFDVYLPRTTSAAGAVAAPPTTHPPAVGTETILLVDDEAMIRDLSQLVLRRAGYHVLLAADGREAVELYWRESSHIDLVILDLMMPRLSGREVLQQLRQINPTVRVVVASGYWPESESGADIEGVLGFVRKPYRETDLLATIRSALDKGRTGESS
jgi:CheY-like chemotaxis protein